ncbi:MAG: hypothetical protein JWM88_1817 [Verrucomicrobia bacterium]|nr:hypothetical protein [Verrucomicrobiota bacterium]
MKKTISLVLLALLPGLLFAEDAKKTSGPEKGTLSNYRVWAKDGHQDALKSALAAHAAKFHTGAWKWRVYEVLTGPDGGAYMITEGPNSWTELEGRGDLGADHMKDYEANVAIHVRKSTSDSYMTYERAGSTVEGGAFSTNKVLLRHMYFKPGRAAQTMASLRAWKQIFAKSEVNVAVWRSFFSGEGRFTVASRLKKGFVDLDDESINFRKAGDELFGPGGYDALIDQNTANLDRIMDEMIEFRPELSSK